MEESLSDLHPHAENRKNTQRKERIPQPIHDSAAEDSHLNKEQDPNHQQVVSTIIYKIRRDSQENSVSLEGRE